MLNRVSIPVLMLFIACSDHDDKQVKLKGNRQLGIHITTARLNSYDAEFQRCKSLGMDVVPLTLPWNVLETSSGFDFSYLEIINFYYPENHVKVSLNITPVYAIHRAVPADLTSKEFDDPLVLQRFKALIDSVYNKTRNTNFNNFIVGLEVDLYLNSHINEWDNFNVFYDSAVKHIKRRWGNTMPVGVETTWSSTVFEAKDYILGLNQHSDMMVLSYYPVLSDFTVKPPNRIHDDIKAVMDLYPDMPLFIVECGYQSAGICNSSYEKQRQFIEEMFRLWDNNADKINFIGFLWLTDLSDTVTEQYVNDYGMTGFPFLDEFKGYLQTLGLRTYAGTGTDKPAYIQLNKELTIRRWIP
ncbi:MAG: hypothetical protein N2044_07220 [Cyclobacteriaceae bacterium]|nr:hypothetical protein [Cyclobacteriaceae bacterium]MCX7637616.1 hypothetical protein [Cyclobacteriaceae bacterium]MDW8331676.1 hypothetical protein [Cyclobacteriaceae bacterium]